MGPSRLEGEEQSVVERYRPDTVVPVYYHPSRPQSAVLERAAAGSNKTFLFLGVGFVAFGMLVPFII
jgi:hypothetical protein